jgi:putative ABC transport system permease protein
MFKNYLKVALRNLWKNKAFSAINIVGLSAGLAVCLLIVLYVKDELGYDKYNAQAENIYRLDADIFFNGTQFTSSVAPGPLAPCTEERLSAGSSVCTVAEFRRYPY